MDTFALSEQIGRLLKQRGLTLSVAESCTAGLLGATLADVPGSSGYFEGGAITYSNRLKELLVHVSPATLAHHGAVSPETAAAMAGGARRAFATGVGVAITGIAGPGGATLNKPVGLTYIAVSTADGEITRRYLFHGNRRENREQAVREALLLIGECLQDKPAATG